MFVKSKMACVGAILAGGLVLSMAATANATVTFYTDRTSFDAAAPGLPVEDFTTSKLGPNSVDSCTGAFNSFTNNDCYATGDILAGISVLAIGNDEMAVVTIGFLGVPSDMIGPNFFVDETQINLANANAIGFDIYNITDFTPCWPIGLSGGLGDRC